MAAESEGHSSGGKSGARKFTHNRGSRRGYCGVLGGKRQLVVENRKKYGRGREAKRRQENDEEEEDTVD